MPTPDDIQAYREQQFMRDALTRYRHQAYDLHLIGDSIGPPSRVSTLDPTFQASLGTSPYPAREDHVHPLEGVPSVSSGNFTPQINATTPPTLGTGGTNIGWWYQFGKLLYIEIALQFGTGGGGGAGSWSITVPNSFVIQTVAPNEHIGMFRANDVSAGNLVTYGGPLTAAVNATTFIIRSVQAPNTGSVTWGAAAPFGVAWAVNDSLSGSCIFRIA